jgi:hypothetical protein
MSNVQPPDRGNLFENHQKKKPSQPDVHGDCVIDTTAYEIRGWLRGDQLAVSFAAPRGEHNTYPPDRFRGALDAVPSRGGSRSKHAEVVATPAWAGKIASDDAIYMVRAFEKQGKSGMYFALSFERLEKASDSPRAD